jgi:hypothetical protein
MASNPIRLRRRGIAEEQLWLPLALLTEEEFVRALAQRGAEVRRVRFKNNRSRLISHSREHGVLNVHACFRSANDDLLDAIAAFILLPSSSAGYRESIERMRAWWDGQAAAPEAHDGARAPVCCGTDEQRTFLRTLYARLNAERFRGALPRTVPLRLSSRMKRRFGHVQYGRNGGRTVEEIALNVDLMLPGNERHLLDTLLHEMAHVEAWVEYGHREHGPVWRAIARRVECEPRACSRVRIRRRSRAAAPATGVPSLPV